MQIRVPAHVLVEKHDPTVTGELGWSQVVDPIPLTGSVGSSHVATWLCDGS